MTDRSDREGQSVIEDEAEKETERRKERELDID